MQTIVDTSKQKIVGAAISTIRRSSTNRSDLEPFLELWMFRFAISENSRGKITKSLLNGMVLRGLPLPIEVIKLGRM